jgi:hypothetical protein
VWGVCACRVDPPARIDDDAMKHHEWRKERPRDGGGRDAARTDLQGYTAPRQARDGPTRSFSRR